jgi:Na+/H+-dicarboxylate symporter
MTIPLVFALFPLGIVALFRDVNGHLTLLNLIISYSIYVGLFAVSMAFPRTNVLKPVPSQSA